MRLVTNTFRIHTLQCAVQSLCNDKWVCRGIIFLVAILMTLSCNGCRLAPEPAETEDFMDGRLGHNAGPVSISPFDNKHFAIIITETVDITILFQGYRPRSILHVVLGSSLRQIDLGRLVVLGIEWVNDNTIMLISLHGIYHCDINNGSLRPLWLPGWFSDDLLPRGRYFYDRGKNMVVIPCYRVNSAHFLVVISLNSGATSFKELSSAGWVVHAHNEYVYIGMRHQLLALRLDDQLALSLVGRIPLDDGMEIVAFQEKMLLLRDLNEPRVFRLGLDNAFDGSVPRRVVEDRVEGQVIAFPDHRTVLLDIGSGLILRDLERRKPDIGPDTLAGRRFIGTANGRLFLQRDSTIEIWLDSQIEHTFDLPQVGIEVEADSP